MPKFYKQILKLMKKWHLNSLSCSDYEDDVKSTFIFTLIDNTFTVHEYLDDEEMEVMTYDL